MGDLLSKQYSFLKYNLWYVYDNFIYLSHFSHLDQCWHKGAVLINQKSVWMKETNFYMYL